MFYYNNRNLGYFIRISVFCINQKHEIINLNLIRKIATGANSVITTLLITLISIINIAFPLQNDDFLGIKIKDFLNLRRKPCFTVLGITLIVFVSLFIGFILSIFKLYYMSIALSIALFVFCIYILCSQIPLLLKDENAYIKILKKRFSNKEGSIPKGLLALEFNTALQNLLLDKNLIESYKCLKKEKNENHNEEVTLSLLDALFQNARSLVYINDKQTLENNSSNIIEDLEYILNLGFNNDLKIKNKDENKDENEDEVKDKDDFSEKEEDELLDKIFSDKGVFSESSTTITTSSVEVDKSIAYKKEIIKTVDNAYNRIEYGEFLKQLASKTNLSVKKLHKRINSILKEDSDPNNKINVYSLKKLLERYDNIFVDEFSEKYSYESLNFTAATSLIKNGEFVPDIPEGLLGKDLHEDIQDDARHLYDKYLTDSTLEYGVLKNKPIEEVLVFGKLPKSAIRVPTFTGGGTSTPDFVYAIKDNNGKVKLNLLIETKSNDIRKSEKVAISAQEKLLKAIPKANWRLVTEPEEVSSILHKLK